VRLLGDLHNYLRFLTGLPRYVRSRITPEEARSAFRRWVEEREENFLRIAERGIFGWDRSPYRRMFELADCEFGDLCQEVRRQGLEPTLKSLREAGVYVTFEEFKGRVPIVRDGKEIAAVPEDFDNPFISRYYQMSTGGSTGKARQVAMDIDHLVVPAITHLVVDSIHGFDGIPTAMWFEGLPGNGLGSVLSRVPGQITPERWFTPVVGPHVSVPRRFRLAERGILAVARAAGGRFPMPEPVMLDRADVIAQWMGETLEKHGSCALRTMVSRALRVCIAAQEMGIDLTGAIVSAGGEPPTEAKVRAITRTGARFISGYHFTEAGPIALACTKPAGEDDLHFMEHHLALIQHPRPVPGFDMDVESFHFTTVLPTAPKLLLNVEIDDYGVIEERSCGCPFEELGLHRHIRRVRSFSKLTGEGVTLVGNDMVRILEEVLPSRFGGSALDYQLQEEEDERGFTRLSVVVSPRVELQDEAAVIDLVLDELGRGEADAGMSKTIWGQAGTLRVKRAEPVWTSRGKLLPLHLGQTRGASDPTRSPGAKASGADPSDAEATHPERSP
jgi:hypothetical protein